jgi:integrase
MIFEDFIKEKSAIFCGGKREKTLISYETSKNHFFAGDGFFKDKRLSEITSELIEQYVAERKAEVSEYSVNQDLAFMKLIFRKAQEWGYVVSSPVSKIKLFKEEESDMRILTDAEAQRLIEAAGSNYHLAHLQPILIVALTTAMRKKEICRLRWEFEGYENEKELADSIVDLKKRLIYIPSELAKNHKKRYIPLSPFLIDFFEKLKENSRSDYVFNVENFYHSFKTVKKLAEIKGRLRIHDLRHTAISRMIEAGVDVVTVSRIAGHSNIQTTQIYCHPSDRAKREAIEKLSEIYGKWRQDGDIVKIQPLQVADYSRVN